jgi:hypothetical protein
MRRDKGQGLREKAKAEKVFQQGARSLQQQVVSGHHGNYDNGMIPPVEDSLALGYIKYKPSNGVRL